MTRIFPRLLLFNVLLVFLPLAGFLYLGNYEDRLLETQERSMVQQGRVLAAALGDAGPLVSEEAVELLKRLERRVDARLRILDSQGRLLADSSRLGPRREEGGSDEVAAPEPRRDWLYRIGARTTLLLQRLVTGRGPSLESGDLYDGAERLEGAEVRAALAGRYGAATRISSGGQRSVTLFSAIPVRSGGAVVGVVLVSQSTARILEALIEVRLDVLRIFLASVLVAAVLGLLFSATIARPLGRLQQQADEIVSTSGRLERRFEGSERSDEIGELARSLEALSLRIEGYQEKLEGFASDVAHEVKNPLASLRSALELIGEVESVEDRQRFLRMAERDVIRMEHVLSEVRELAEFDAGPRRSYDAVDVSALAQQVVDGYSYRSDLDRVEFDLSVPAAGLPARVDEDHFVRVLTNLLDNALSFSPKGDPVSVSVEATGRWALVSVCDRGPGVAADEAERIFDRFYSSRPPSQRGHGHLGLGLSIVKAIVESYGGRVSWQPRDGGGSRFSASFPAELTRGA